MSEKELEKEAEEYVNEVFGLYCPTDQERVQVVDAYIAGAEPREKCIDVICHEISEGAKVCLYLKEQLEYAKVIIQDLLNNSDEYARQRAIDWLEEIEQC